MALDGRIASGVGTLLFLGALVAGAVAQTRAGRLRSNPEHFEGGRTPFLITPRHLLSDRGWTPAGLAARREWFRAGLRTTLLVVGAWVILDALF